METLVKDKTYTVEEYFALEEASEVRHEFISGQLFEMSGGTKKHYLTIKRLERLLEAIFENIGYLVYREKYESENTRGAKILLPRFVHNERKRI